MKLKQLYNPVFGYMTIALLKAARTIDVDRLGDFFAAVARRFGPWLKEHKIGRANLATAYPEKAAEEIERILLGVWDNLGRVAAEFAHLDKLHQAGWPQNGRLWASEEDLDRARMILASGRPALVFSAHLANWELGALAAHMFGAKSVLLYRRPNVSAIADAVIRLRGDSMGTLIPTGLDAPIRLANALEEGSQVGMLVDQYNTRGVDVTFFGRPARTDPLIARLAQHFDCPIHGVYVVREPDRRFRLCMTEAIAPVRNADGKVDIAQTMQRINDVVEGWVRDNPEQWLWLHRRWRE